MIGLPLPELERRALAAERLKEELSSIPFYAKRAAERGPDYWIDLLDVRED
jgi:hypothetical protein